MDRKLKNDYIENDFFTTSVSLGRVMSGEPDLHKLKDTWLENAARKRSINLYVQTWVGLPGEKSLSPR